MASPFSPNTASLDPALAGVGPARGLIMALLRADDGRAEAELYNHLRRHGSMRRTCREMLAPAAERLGELWVSDDADFSSVTRGTGLLQQWLRTDPNTPAEHHLDLPPTTIALAPNPGEQHTLGLSVLGNQLAAAGADVRGGPQQSVDDLLRQSADPNLDALGLSVSCDRWLEPTIRLLERLVSEAANPSCVFLLGGGVADRNPDLSASLPPGCLLPGSADDAVAQLIRERRAQQPLDITSP